VLIFPSGTRSYVYDVIRSTLPRLELDEAFVSKVDVAHEVKHSLQDKMRAYGYEIVEALVTDLTPDQHVRNSMNEINANRRLRLAAGYRAEAEKVTLVKAAEADSESKYLSGLGVAKQRKAIMHGLRESVMQFSEKITDTTAKDVMGLLLMTQYYGNALPL
jgi:regulator of protease activity HflC (stomatin/prohibitin superfamily)